VYLLRPYKTGKFWKSLQGCTRGVSQEVHPTAGETPTNPLSPASSSRRDTGTFPLGHASRPQPRLPSRPVPGLTLSMCRSVADVLSAHGPSGKVPVSRLGFVESNRIRILRVLLASGCHTPRRFLHFGFLLRHPRPRYRSPGLHRGAWLSRFFA